MNGQAEIKREDELPWPCAALGLRWCRCVRAGLEKSRSHCSVWRPVSGRVNSGTYRCKQRDVAQYIRHVARL